ncbi:MAG: GumC family protein, partial [Cyclobacteriaceae bacterium]
GYVITSEAYGYLPVHATLAPGSTGTGTGRYQFTIRNDRQFELADESGSLKRTCFFGDTVTMNGQRLRVERLENRSLDAYRDVPFVMSINSVTGLAASYVGRLKVDWAEQGSGVINLSMSSVNPQKDMDFLNGLISTYQQQDLDKKNEKADRTIRFIGAQLASLRDSLRMVEFQLERFGSKGRVSDLSSDAQRLYAKLEAFTLQQTELLIRANYFKYLDDYLRNTSNSLDQVILPSAMGISDPVLTSLLGKMMDLQLELKMMNVQEQSQNPLVSSKVSRLAEVKRDLQEAVTTLTDTDKIKIEFLNKQAAGIERQLQLLPSSERQIISVQRNYTLLENLYVFLMQKMSETSIARESNTSDIVLVNPPMRGGAVSPNPRRNFTIAVLLGLALPFGLFVLLEMVNNRIQSREDIERFTAIPFIGGVGHNRSKDNREVFSHPRSSISESFRALRANLQYFLQDKRPAVLLVTSSISGEGKTFTSVNLASVFSLSGMRTLIVGADMRRPKLYADFDLDNQVGLSNYLAGLSDFEGVVRKTRHDNLDVITGGPVPPNPSELLLTDRMELFVREARSRYDYVIIDSPPLAIVADAFTLATLA